jgi:hypothetical protein
MREENPITDAGIGGRTEVSARPANSLVSVGMFAGRFRWVICAVASVVGIGGMVGAIGGMLIAELVGHVLQVDKQLYDPVFHCRLGVPYCVALDPHAEPKARARSDWTGVRG